MANMQSAVLRNDPLETRFSHNWRWAMLKGLYWYRWSTTWNLQGEKVNFWLKSWYICIRVDSLRSNHTVALGIGYHEMRYTNLSKIQAWAGFRSKESSGVCCCLPVSNLLEYRVSLYSGLALFKWLRMAAQTCSSLCIALRGFGTTEGVSYKVLLVWSAQISRIHCT